MFKIIVALVATAGMMPLALGGKYNMVEILRYFPHENENQQFLIIYFIAPFSSLSIKYQGPMISNNTTTWNNFRKVHAQLLLPSP